MSEANKTYGRAQTIFRVAKNADNPYVMMDRRPLEKVTLSWGAKGLLGYLLSRPDDWVVRFKDLVNRSTDGAHKVRGFLWELRNAGHVAVITHREGGRIVEWEYKVFEVPPDGDFQEVEIPEVVNRTSTNNKRSLTKRKLKGAAPAPAKEPKPAEPKATEYPELVVFKELTGRWPNRLVWEKVIGRIKKVSSRLSRPVTKDELLPFFTAWLERSNNVFNLTWLEWAEVGTVPQNGWRQNANSKDISQSNEYSEADRAAAERIRARKQMP